MDRLKNKVIFVGKEPDYGRLLVAMEVNGQTKVAVIGEKGNVPNSVSRCKPTEGVAHCKISIDKEGIMTLVNLKPQNVTYVNGSEIISKKITADSEVELGKDKYLIPIDKIIETAKKMVGTVAPKAKTIRHLEKVWREYETRNEEITRRLQNKQRKRMLPIVIGSASGLISPVCAWFSGNTLYVTIPIALISLLIYVKLLVEKDTSVEDRKVAQDKLIDNYVCPHEDCNHFLGVQPYKVIRQNRKCPYCGKPWTEK